jgi:O-antigen/teichoic acid export membrane protein
MIHELGLSATARRLLGTTFWSAVGESLSRGLMLLALVLVARILGQTGYGELGIVRTTINVFAVLGGVGLGLTANRYVASYRDSDKTYSGQIIGSSFVLAIGFGAIVGACLAVTSGYLARSFLGAPQLATPLKIAGLLVFLGAINGAQVGVLQGLEAYRRLALGGFLQGSLALCFFVAGSYYYGLNGALGAFVIHAGGGALIFQALIRRELRRQQISVAYRPVDKTLPILWRFSVPAALMGVAVAPFKWLVEAMLAKGSGFQQLGLFHAGMIIASIYIVLVSTVNSPLISLNANLPDSKARPRIQYVTLYGSWYLFLVLAAPCVLFPQLPSTLFGEGFDTPDFHEVTLLLLVYCGLLMYSQGIMRLLAQHGSLWFGLLTNLCEGVALLVGFYSWSYRGVVGLGLAYVCSYLVRVGASIPFVVKKQIASTALLLDKFFAITIIALFAIVALQLRRIAG